MTENYTVTKNDAGYTVKRNDGAAKNEFGPYIYSVRGDKASLWFSSNDGVITCARRTIKDGVKEYSGVQIGHSAVKKDGDTMSVKIGGLQVLTLSEADIARFESDLIKYKDNPFGNKPKEQTDGDGTKAC